MYYVIISQGHLNCLNLKRTPKATRTALLTLVRNSFTDKGSRSHKREPRRERATQA